jgi:cation-transporting P-type ATPase I
VDRGCGSAAALTVLTAAKPDLLLRMASIIGKRVTRHAGDADRYLTNVVSSARTWVQEFPGLDNSAVDEDRERAPQRALAPIG